MTTFKLLMVATDFRSMATTRYAAQPLLAHEHGAGLRILHAEGQWPPALRDWFSPTIDVDLKAAQSREEVAGVAVEISSASTTRPPRWWSAIPFEALLQAAVGGPGGASDSGHSRLEAPQGRRHGRSHAQNLPAPGARRQDARHAAVPPDPGADRLHGRTRGRGRGRGARGRGAGMCMSFTPSSRSARRQRCDAGVRTHHPRDAHDGRGRYRRAHAPTSSGRHVR